MSTTPDSPENPDNSGASPHYVLAFSCENHPGIVAAVTSTLVQLGCDITDGQQFDDHLSGRFFLRLEFRPVRVDIGEAGFRAGLAPVMASLDAQWTIRDTARRMRVMLMASQSDHCLRELLYRWNLGEMPMDPVAIVSNHERGSFGNLYDVPFYHFPVFPETKPQQEAQILEVIERERVDLVVLARYMQILSPELTEQLQGRCINIHHSFLPGFKGARPYHQAYARGVKIIGATAHYVTTDLDEGPIIAQAVERVSHRDVPDALIRKGRDIERRVLAEAVLAHLEDRVMLRDGTTVVFPA